MKNLNKWSEMTNIEAYRTCEDKSELRRLIKSPYQQQPLFFLYIIIIWCCYYHYYNPLFFLLHFRSIKIIFEIDNIMRIRSVSCLSIVSGSYLLWLIRSHAVLWSKMALGFSLKVLHYIHCGFSWNECDGN